MLIGMFYIPVQVLFSQHISKDNYTGNWETATSWNQEWAVPQTSISSFDITINGYITRAGSLTFTGGRADLIVSDTLVIAGDLTLGHENSLIIADNGVLIIRGDLKIDDDAYITANGYLVVTGDIIRTGGNTHRSFTSNDSPVKVFIGGTIDPSLQNNQYYPVLKCAGPPAFSYANSGCTYGNVTDIINDPIFTFFQTTCANANASSNSPVCAGNTINLVSSGGTGYSWVGPNGFISSDQNPTRLTANAAMAGAYTVTVKSRNGCTDTSSTNLIVNALPLVNITSVSSQLCVNDQQILTGNPAGGSFIVTGGPGNISGNVLSATGTGNIILEYYYTNVCTNKAIQSIFAKERPVAVPGPDQTLKFIFETKMEAELSSFETGEWSLISGSGKIWDIHSPISRVSELPIGENNFLWMVRNGKCEAGAKVTISVNDLFVPSVITPNWDGKNDYFKISALAGRVELVILNRWGNVEYENSNYLNNWDGRNNKGKELADDTYIYIFKLGNGTTRKGTVLITR